MEGIRHRSAGTTATIAAGPDLARRLRAGLWIVVLWGIPFVLVDAWLSSPAFAAVLAVEAVQMGALLGVIGWLQVPRRRRSVRKVAVAAVSGIYVLTATSAALRGDLGSTAFSLVACAIISGGFLPWGGAAQLASVLVATAALLGNALAVPRPGIRAVAYPTLGILAAFGGSVWVALEAERERRARRRGASLLAGQSHVLELMARGVALPAVLDALCTAMEAQTRGMLCSVLRLEGDHLHDAAGPSLPDDFRRVVHGTRIGPDAGCCGSAAYLRRTVAVRDIETDPRWAPLRQAALRHGLQACWAAPILAGDGECLGTFAMYFRHDRGASAEEERLLDTAAQLAGIALSRARDEAGLARSGAQLAEESQVSGALLRVAEGFLSALDTPRVLRELCRLARGLVGCEGAAAVLRDPEARVASVTADTAHGPWPLDGLRLPDAAVAALLRRIEGRPLVSLRGEMRDPLTEQLWEHAGVRRALAAPLRRGSGAEPAGLMLLADRSLDAPFTPLQERIASGVAKLGSLALENAHLVEQLRTATAAKSEFVSTISHELRTPISVIVGYTDMLADEGLGAEERRGIVQRVRRTSHELLELIQATLDLSRLEGGRDGPRLERVAVHELLGDMATDFAAIPRDGGPVLRWEEGAPLECASDPRKLRIIVKNLVENALKFTPEGTVTVRYRAAPGRWELEVEDTGIGIPADQLGVIFEMFRQGDGSDSRSFGGVGLGLYLVRRLANQLGGSVRVASTPERGSTFTVVLPLGTTPVLGVPRFPATSAPQATAVPGRPRTEAPRTGAAEPQDAPTAVPERPGGPGAAAPQRPGAAAPDRLPPIALPREVRPTPAAAPADDEAAAAEGPAWPHAREGNRPAVARPAAPRRPPSVPRRGDI